MTNFGKIPQYASYVAQDPFRHGLLFPAVVKGPLDPAKGYRTERLGRNLYMVTENTRR